MHGCGIGSLRVIVGALVSGASGSTLLLLQSNRGWNVGIREGASSYNAAQSCEEKATVGGCNSCFLYGGV